MNADIEEKGLTRVEYLDSKWERNLGDIMKIEGAVMRVGAIAETRAELIRFGNALISKQNKANKKRDERIMADMIADGRANMERNIKNN